MSPETAVINPDALAPLFEPWEEPNAHRVKNPVKGEQALIDPRRRPSPIEIVQNLREAVHLWRESFYLGASDTTRELLGHWFERPHRMTSPSGEDFEFRYYFCQREAIETLIYLKEVRHIDRLSPLIAEFGGANREIAALGITAEEDAWSKYAFKIATGAGKTKCMALSIVWSYFHALYEPDSPMARHFVIIAPNLTVYERLKEDFGDGRIFDGPNCDPLIPAEWKADWNMSIVLQDEASGAATGGVIYLTNIHRLFDPKKRKIKKDAETYGFMGPSVSRAKALDTGAELRERITSHPRLMVMNDEAHHVWDPDSAWNEAITYLHETNLSRTGGTGGLVAQLDFSATPKDNKGQLFKHIICDTPLGEAVDGGIVKTPVIGMSKRSLTEEPSDDAAYRYDRHLRLGYERWKLSKEEWAKSRKKALLFVMCADTEAADQIANRLNHDDTFKELNGKTINLHTNLKGKVKKVGSGANARMVFKESEKEITDEDLKKLRELSRSLDQNTSPYYCIVSVLMLREGWDVKNVTTIVPLRAYSAESGILAEQTLGRGLRRMSAPGSQGANEIVTVVDHPNFAALYQDQLAQEGLLVEIVDVDKVPATTISIFPDEAKKDLKALEIAIPGLSASHRIVPMLDDLTLDDVKAGFGKYKPILLGKRGEDSIEYEGRQLFTGEIIERMKIDLPLLQFGEGAITYFVKQLEQVCKLRNLHVPVAPLIKTFLTEILFEEEVELNDVRLLARLGDTDVQEHIRAVFVPLIRARTTTTEKRLPQLEPNRLSLWKPYQVTHSERKPAEEAKNTLFNLVPCTRQLEVAFTHYANLAGDTVAFAKNAGPQCLRIDYLASGGRLAFYTPDFFVRTEKGPCYLVETKGRVDLDVPRKARAAMQWCESASTEESTWEYLYVPEGLFESHRGSSMRELADSCRVALQNLVDSETLEATMPLFATAVVEQEEKKPEVASIIPEKIINALPDRYRKAVEESITLYQFLENKQNMNFASAFTGLMGALDEAAKGMVVRKLQDAMPAARSEQEAWFRGQFGSMDGGMRSHYDSMARNLKKTLVFNNGVMPLGLLRNCLNCALNERMKFGGVFDVITDRFRTEGSRKFLQLVESVYNFRNTRVAHQEEEIKDSIRAVAALKQWVALLHAMSSVA